MLREVTLDQALEIYLKNKDANIQIYSPMSDCNEKCVAIRSLKDDILNFDEGSIILTDAELPVEKKIPKKNTGVKRPYNRKKGKPEGSSENESDSKIGDSDEKKKVAPVEEISKEPEEVISKSTYRRLEVQKATDKVKKEGTMKILDDKGKLVDTGKIRALYRAKWSLEDIADEMNIEDAVLLGYMRQMGLCN